MLNVKNFQVGQLATNCYLITDNDTSLSAVVDPGAKSSTLDKAISQLQADSLKYILLTHGHFDHIAYATEIANRTGAKIVIGKNDENFLFDPSLNLALDMGIQIPSAKADVLVCEGDTIELGNTEIKVIDLPGHTKGGVGYVADSKLFCGDTMFKNSMGRTDFITGNEFQLMKSLKKLSTLPDETVAFCGHGESTTIGDEKRGNSYVRYAMMNM